MVDGGYCFCEDCCVESEMFTKSAMFADAVNIGEIENI